MNPNQPFILSLALAILATAAARAEEPPREAAAEPDAARTAPSPKTSRAEPPKKAAEARKPTGKATAPAEADERHDAEPSATAQKPVTTRPRPVRRAERRSTRVVLAPVDVHGRAARPQAIVDIPRKEPRFSVGTAYLSERAQRWLKPRSRR